MDRSGFDYLRHDRLTVSVVWDQEIHPDTGEPRLVEVSKRRATAYFVERQPSTFWGECVGRAVGSVGFARPLLVLASAVCEVLDWELSGPAVIDEEHVERLHDACRRIIQAYEDLDRDRVA